MFAFSVIQDKFRDSILVLKVPLDDSILIKYLRSEEPRYNDSTLFMMRKEMVDQKDGVQRMTVKVHMDDMKRVTIREQVG